MDIERQVASHYGRSGLENTILQALRSSGKDVDKLAPGDLSGADEFHLGWRQATVELARDLQLSDGMHVLDVGSGLGGPARYFAEVHGSRVTGVDLTQEYVDVAAALTRRCGLEDRVHFQQASALALPFEEASFNAATLIHVGMNIRDKPKLFEEVHRVLKPGARFAVYDIMRTGDQELSYPMPWATTAETSFVETPQTYRDLLTQVGFRIESEQSRRDLSLELGRKMREQAEQHGPSPLGLHILMGPATPERLGNVIGALAKGIIAPIQMIARSA